MINGQEISVRRKELGWTQDQLAWKAGVSVRTVRNVEAGILPTAANLWAILGALRLELSIVKADGCLDDWGMGQGS